MLPLRRLGTLSQRGCLHVIYHHDVVSETGGQFSAQIETVHADVPGRGDEPSVLNDAAYRYARSHYVLVGLTA